MAEQTPSDLFMMFVYKGQAIRGESQSKIDLKSSPLSSGFKKDCMFEVQNFTLKTGLESDDPDTKAMKTAMKQAKKGIADAHKKIAELQEKVGMQSGQSGASRTTPDLASGQDYAKWRDGDEVQYPVDMDPFSFTRAMDRATSDLLTHCIERKPFDRAAIIKRKAAGGAAAGEVFLRIDFTKVLLINVAWSHDEPIKETYQFVSRAVTIRYAPQLPSGLLGDPLPPAFWSMSKSYHPYVL